MFGSVAAILIGLSQSGAPSDVPPNHWAFKAVDELFSAGILHGYPAQVGHLKLEKVKPVDEFLNGRIMWWKQNGLLVGSPDGVMCHRSQGPPSRYEQAVALHAVWTNLIGISAEPTVNKGSRSGFVPDLVTAISMRAWELRRLGADPASMIESLNRRSSPPFRAFRG